MILKFKTNGTIQLKSIPNFTLAIPEGETVQSFQQFAYVVDCISMLMQQKLPTLGYQPLTIINESSPDNPRCLKELNLILLDTKPSLWSQIAYQYSHELCHYAIPQGVPQNLRWIEESICEMASLYFLRQIGYLWLKQGITFKRSDGRPYAFAFIEYAEDTATRFTEFDFQDSSIIERLERDCYLRRYNMHLANHLLPIFTEHSDAWEAVPFLGQIQDLPLHEALDAWILLSPQQAQPALRQIRNLF